MHGGAVEIFIKLGDTYSFLVVKVRVRVRVMIRNELKRLTFAKKSNGSAAPPCTFWR